MNSRDHLILALSGIVSNLLIIAAVLHTALMLEEPHVLWVMIVMPWVSGKIKTSL
jgi:hypothetical protein